MPPSDIRRFERKPYLRMKTIPPGALSLEKLALLARNRGYNARVVKNKSHHSLYIRPRQYNRPIPETDPSRISTFPTALAMSSKGDKMGRMLLGRQLGSNERPMVETNSDLDANPKQISDYIEGVYEENKQQIDGQTAEIEDWLQSFGDQEKKLKELEIQSISNLKGLSEGVYSNLTESQWGLIQSEPKIAKLLKSKTMNDVLEKTALRGLLTLSGPYEIKKENSEFIKELDGITPGSLGFAENKNEVLLISKTSPQVTIQKYPVEFFNQYFEKVKDRVLTEWRKEFISYLRSEDETEHSLLASMIRKDSLEDIQYWKWPGYDRDVVKQLIKQETDLKPTSTGGIKLSINIDTEELEAFLNRIGVSSIIQQINRPYEKKYFTDPRKTFSHGNQTRQRIANYLWQRKIEGDEVISTDDIQRHLSKNMKKPPVTRQTTKFLDQDPRFEGMGKVRKVKLWKLSGE